MAVTEYPLKSQSLECRPLHGSLLLVLLVLLVLFLPLLYKVGREVCAGVGDGRVGLAGLVKVTWRDCMLLADRAASLDRLRERPRMRAVIAPKKDSSVGEDGPRDMGDVGDNWPDEVVFWESEESVRIGGVGWNVDWLCDAIYLVVAELLRVGQ